MRFRIEIGQAAIGKQAIGNNNPLIVKGGENGHKNLNFFNDSFGP
jgi:hypothetical protein